MKRTILSILAMLLLTAGALVAQTTNTTAPGPTTQREPSVTNNNLPNPGNPQTDTKTNREAMQEQGTASESMDATDTSDTMDTSTTTGTTGSSTSYGTTGSTATETDTMNQTDTTGGNTDTLPGTASPLPLIGLVGLLAMAAAVALRARRA